ncbi:NAD(+) diphosphatase [Butyrivibrio sp. XPD2006]|uniref:NAD(+) diphosphatase n=1 Tax=Butyrivibrio sp. XPD2006 TaxID=1280668 RepID=UPI0003B6BF39|nr:NAD(+) diphosphatase [Butyrivibrio sp. XPD2006]
MIQDINPLQLNNHYDPNIKADDDSPVVVYSEKSFLLAVNEETGEIAYPHLSELEGAAESDLVYIFGIGDEMFFLFLGNAAGLSYDRSRFSFTDFSKVRSKFFLPKHYVYAAFTALHLAEWYDVTRFCGKCGSENVNDKAERARVCPKCGNKIYPRINPAVIIGVTDKESNRLVLTKYRTGFGHNALVAGFTEIGETLEETVKREVMEEVGLKVTNIRYYKSQPWGMASDVLAGFFCDVTGDTEIKMDDQELKYAEWNLPEEIVLQPMDYSLTNEMMKLFKEHGYGGTV